MKRSQTKIKQSRECIISSSTRSIHNNKPLPLPKLSNQIQTKSKLSSILNLPNHKSQYQFKQKIGEGAFAQVCLAKRVEDGKIVAIKVYNKMKLYDKQRKKCVQNQINILKNVDHQNIIKFIDSYETQKTINIVMEYFSTSSLRNYMLEKTKLTQEQLKAIILQIVNTLSYLHEKQIAHRDIKLQNILIDKKTKNIKIIDFGFAVKSSGIFALSGLTGTPCYLSPEMLSSKQYDPFKADVWAMGILFYFLCVGYFPFRSIDNKVLQNKIVKGEVIFPKQINPGCEYLISKMLKYDKDDRIQMKQVLQDTWAKPVDFSRQILLLKNKAIINEVKQFSKPDGSAKTKQ